MKVKLAVPEDILNGHQIGITQKHLAKNILSAVGRNFPDWRDRIRAGNINGGEVIVQKTDLTEPIEGLKPGVHLTMSLISYKAGRNYRGLAMDAITEVKLTRDEKGENFMEEIAVYVQMSLDRPVIKNEDGTCTPSPDGTNLLEYPE